ncbi:hypothetical protein KQ939_15895 [Planococcus sp. CP5-4]|uniref:hypothetical protein n=1 Tax=unclassified Planococcus (in: firmicutes) TaxID=2662419 RepID=UPI001C228130|nr:MULTISPECIES: hypothetical protein [unclassified Planococcus (in: firmicutes)]MBU9674568.1 hypothetical protein [Planococcus sp. CP5-4_YE]MBV0910308.1 hypothetical protein [Planococcus sp. CP5-4_UN]MBW6065159.1 hypothetical protein [Planococcus sp. CP5-4]
MTTPMTRSKLRKETNSLYLDMIVFYRRFSKVHEPAPTDLRRMKLNLDRLNPTSTGEQIEAIRFLEFFLAIYLGQIDSVHEAERIQLIGRAKEYTIRDSRQRRALRKWRREVEESSEQAV